MMAAAYLVKYRGPSGKCPDAVVIFDTGDGEDLAKLAAMAKEALVRARGGWKPHQVSIEGMTYLGPWFSACYVPTSPKSPGTQP
jgi:hypothetical protein